MTRQQAKRTIEAPGDGWFAQRYYVIDFDDLSDPSLKELSYKGTTHHYHLFKIYTKCTTDESYVYDLAIPRDQCDVVDPRPVEEETRNLNHGYRTPVRENGKCKVDARPPQPVPSRKGRGIR